MFKIQYELHPSPIPSIFWTTYRLLAQREYDNLLENYPDDEKVFQEFSSSRVFLSKGLYFRQLKSTNGFVLFNCRPTPEGVGWF